MEEFAASGYRVFLYPGGRWNFYMARAQNLGCPKGIPGEFVDPNVPRFILRGPDFWVYPQLPPSSGGEKLDPKNR